MSRRGEREGENREVFPLFISDTRGDLSGAGVGARSRKEGGTRGKHGFPRATEAKPREAPA